MTTRPVSPNDTFVEIQRLVAAHLGMRISDVEPESQFSDLDVDSLELVELIVLIEKQLGISLNIQQARTCKTPGQLAELVQAVRVALTVGGEEQ